MSLRDFVALFLLRCALCGTAVYLPCPFLLSLTLVNSTVASLNKRMGTTTAMLVNCVEMSNLFTTFSHTKHAGKSQMGVTLSGSIKYSWCIIVIF